MVEEIEAEWSKCHECLTHKNSKSRSPPIISIDIMIYPVSEMLSVDLFELNNKHYLLGVDKCSEYMP